MLQIYSVSGQGIKSYSIVRAQVYPRQDAGNDNCLCSSLQLKIVKSLLILVLLYRSSLHLTVECIALMLHNLQVQHSNPIPATIQLTEFSWFLSVPCQMSVVSNVVSELLNASLNYPTANIQNFPTNSLIGIRKLMV